MIFMELSSIYYLIPVLIFFWVYIYLFEKKYYKWVELHWFYKRSFVNKIALFIYIVGVGVLSIALLDLRSRPERVGTNIPDQKTIILIDVSRSMLAEDVRPNRFKKAIMVARHFVKKAVGHKISIVIFSETTRRVVPFTDDIDLLDSRLTGLESLKIVKGGSNISTSIKEVIQYLSPQDSGNLLILTDMEEHERSIQLSISDDINVALVGVGTVRGGPIPLRDNTGNLSGYLKHKGSRV